jgi:hypothetical protein
MSEIPADRPPDATGPTPPGGAGYGTYPTARPRRNGIGTAALVVGVVALVLVVLILFPPLGALLGLVAVILGIVRSTEGRPTTAARPWLAWSPGRWPW